MINASYKFSIKGVENKTEILNLDNHLKARKKIVDAANSFDFEFDPYNLPRRNGYSTQDFWDRTNAKGYAMRCRLARVFVLEFGGKDQRYRPVDGTWIPADGTYIDNLSQTLNPLAWSPANEGQNLIYVGKGLFWGHHPGQKTRTMGDWEDSVDDMGNGKGNAVLPGENDPDHYKNNKDQLFFKNHIKFPSVGLD